MLKPDAHEDHLGTFLVLGCFYVLQRHFNMGDNLFDEISNLSKICLLPRFTN